MIKNFRFFFLNSIKTQQISIPYIIKLSLHLHIHILRQEGDCTGYHIKVAGVDINHFFIGCNFVLLRLDDLIIIASVSGSQLLHRPDILQEVCLNLLNLTFAVLRNYEHFFLKFINCFLKLIFYDLLIFVDFHI